MPPLLMQYFKNGLEVVAKNLKWRLKRIKVVMFQLMMNTPMAMPTNSAATMLHIAQVFGRQVSGICAECLHESTIHRAEQYEPEDQQHLEFLEVQQNQLNRKRMI